MWVSSTLEHVRPGDVIRPAGSTAESVVAERYYSPTNDARGRNSWHMVPGEKHWNDRVVQESEVCISFASDPTHFMFMRPDFPVEIQATVFA